LRTYCHFFVIAPGLALDCASIRDGLEACEVLPASESVERCGAYGSIDADNDRILSGLFGELF
jgi:hypothetical protein